MATWYIKRRDDKGKYFAGIANIAGIPMVRYTPKKSEAEKFSSKSAAFNMRKRLNNAIVVNEKETVCF